MRYIMKTKHAKVGLLNILFMPGAGGTFLANMLAKAITDPWWKDYIPEPPNDLFKATNEYVNQYNHIVMTWHPFDISKTDNMFDLKDVCWINLTITKEEAKFANIMSAIKQQDYINVTKESILDRLYATNNTTFDNTHKWQKVVAPMLGKNNKVLDVKFNDIFVDGNTDVILSILNLIFQGQYITMDVVENIAGRCIAKHKADMHLYNELIYDPDKTIDQILAKVLSKEPNSS